MKRMKIVVRVPNWIGDSVMCLPAIYSVSKNFPDAQIWVAARNWVKDIFSHIDFITGTVPLLKETSFHNTYKNICEIKKRKFDLGLLFTNSFSSALLFYLARISKRWGYAREGRSFLLSKAISLRDKSLQHQIYYYLDLLKAVGLQVEKPNVFLSLTSEEREWAEETLRQLNIPANSLIIGLNPGSFYGSAKRWPEEYFASLANKFITELNAKLLLFGSKNEVPIAKKLLSLTNRPIFNFVGKTSLRQLIALISKCSLFVTNDSGPMHIANALRIPVVAIFGPTNPERTGPFHHPYRIIQKKVTCFPCKYRDCPLDHKCMRIISVNEVFEISKGFLQ